MRSKLIVSSVFLALFALITSSSFSQQKECCKDKSSNECTPGNTSCDKHGNAGGDSTVSSTGMTCPVSGEAIGEGQGVNFEYLGKTYTFCCEGCVGKFKKEPMGYIKEGMTCPVTGEPIESKDVFVMHNDTKYYFCCKSCVKKFENDPEKFMNGNKN